MSHITGTVQPVAPAVTLGPDSGAAPTSPNTWALNFAHLAAPGGTKLLMLHFQVANFPGNNRLEVDLGYDTDVFTAADGSDFWTRPINIYALAGGLVPIRYITNGAATGGVQLDQYGRGERHTKDLTNASALFDSFSNCDPFLGDSIYTEPDYAKFWLCHGLPPNWENIACTTAAGDIRSTVAPSVGMVLHVDFNAPLNAFILSTCTVTLVSADTVITAGHCMANPIEDGKSGSVTFDYRTNCDGSRPAGYNARFFKVKEVIRQRYADGTSSDYCFLRLQVPSGGLGIPPITMRTSLPALGEQVFGIHHPNGAVKKLSVPHSSFATVASSSSTSIGMDLDVAGGSSGSGLFDATGQIIGVLSNGGACGLSYYPLATILQDLAAPTPITRDVMLVFDRSGSMSLPGTSGASKIEEARTAASLFVQLVRAGTGNRVGLVSFSTTASLPVDFALSAVTPATKATLIGPAPFNGGIVGGLTPGGATTIGGGLNAAYAQLVPLGNPRNVLLLTDGLQNTPPMVNPLDLAPTDINIDVIGYGTPANLDGAMLTGLATLHHGQYVLADTNLKLQKFFALAFGNIFEAGLLLDPEFVLPQGTPVATPVPFNVCEEESLTVVVGWESRRSSLVVEVTTPLGATVTSASPGTESYSATTWTFLKIPFPINGERDGVWKAVVRRASLPGAEVLAPAPEVRYFISVVASGGAVLRRMPDQRSYFTGDTINPLVGLQYLKGGLPPNAQLNLTVVRPDVSVGNLLSNETLGTAMAIDADIIPPRQATLLAIEQRTGHPVVGYTQQAFPLFDDVASSNAPEPAGVYGTAIKDLLTVEGNYTFHCEAKYGDGCTATREVQWSIHVEPGIDATHTSVATTLNGSDGTITFVPKDQYDNKIGPGRGDGFTVTGAPGTTVTGPVRDNGDGSYTAPVHWNASTGQSPGIVLGQPGRPPVVVLDPTGHGRQPCRKWKLLCWLALLVALILLFLWISK